MVFQVRRRRHEYQCIVSLGNAVDVVLEMNLRRVEMNAGQIAGIMAHTTKIVNLVVTAHIPADVVRVLHHNLGNGCCPTSAANDGYTTSKPTQALPKVGM